MVEVYEMNQRTVLLTVPIALLTSCQSLTDKPTVGRYQMATTATKTLKLDTVTGQTWFLARVLHFLRLPCARVCRGLRFQTRSVWSKQFFNVLLFFSCRGTSICGTFIL